MRLEVCLVVNPVGLKGKGRMLGWAEGRPIFKVDFEGRMIGAVLSLFRTRVSFVENGWASLL